MEANILPYTTPDLWVRLKSDLEIVQISLFFVELSHMSDKFLSLKSCSFNSAKFIPYLFK